MTTTESIALGDGYLSTDVVLTTSPIMQQRAADWLVVGVPYGVANLRESSIFR